MGPLIVAESRYAPQLKTPLHWHETASFTTVFAGNYREDFTHRRFECFAGGFLYRPAGEIHRDRIGASGAHCLMVEVPVEWIARIAGKSCLTLSSPRHTPSDAGIFSRIRRELLLSDELSPMTIEALTIELACASERTWKTGNSPWIVQLREWIADEFAALPPLGTLARRLGVHPGHMSRVFRSRFGCTIGEYARGRKIEYCCGQLRRNDASLCDIAARAGFSSQAHMTRVFKIHMGMPPGEFRRRCRRNWRAKMQDM